MLRGSVEATRDMDAGDEGEVWGREDGLLTGFRRGSVCSPRWTVLDLASSGTSKRCDVGERVSKGTEYVRRLGQFSYRPATDEGEGIPAAGSRGARS